MGDDLEERLMPEFVMIPDEGLRVHLDIDEAGLFRELLKEMKTLLEADIPRADPVIARLFPDAHKDPAEAERYREMVGDDLHQLKEEALRTVAERVGASGNLVSSIPEDEIESWLTVLTDLRLAIGTRLDVTEEMMGAEFDENGPDAPALSVLHWLGWLQESILAELSKGGELDARQG